jgi:hypothetical protein
MDLNESYLSQYCSIRIRCSISNILNSRGHEGRQGHLNAKTSAAVQMCRYVKEPSQLNDCCCSGISSFRISKKGISTTRGIETRKYDQDYVLVCALSQLSLFDVYVLYYVTQRTCRF